MYFLSLPLLFVILFSWLKLPLKAPSKPTNWNALVIRSYYILRTYPSSNNSQMDIIISRNLCSYIMFIVSKWLITYKFSGFLQFLNKEIERGERINIFLKLNKSLACFLLSHHHLY